MPRLTNTENFSGPHLIQSSSFCTDSGVLWYPSGQQRIMVSERDAYDLYNNLSHFHPVELDLATIQIWISSCKSPHTTEGSTRCLELPKYLQVIDCERLEVVSAPLQCQCCSIVRMGRRKFLNDPGLIVSARRTEDCFRCHRSSQGSWISLSVGRQICQSPVFESLCNV